MMDKGIIYYTDNELEGSPIFETAKKFILASGLPIVSCSLKPLDFGENICLQGLERGYPAMVLQILTALEASTCKWVFFCEHDVLYHRSHFDFTPPCEDLYFYNVNNWRWLWQQDYLISYDGLTSLSMMCCSRELALKHYRYRHEHIEEFGLNEIKSKEPHWARRLGYEPGTKPRRRGGLTDENHVKVRSQFPNVDIRHDKTFSAPKVHLEHFKHLPTNWRVATMDEIPGWDLKGLFGLCN